MPNRRPLLPLPFGQLYSADESTFPCAEKVKHLPVDLQEAPVEILQQLSSAGANDVTHIFFTAFIGE